MRVVMELKKLISESDGGVGFGLLVAICYMDQTLTPSPLPLS